MFDTPFRFIGTVADLRKRLPFWRSIGAGQAQAEPYACAHCTVPLQHSEIWEQDDNGDVLCVECWTNHQS